MAELDPINILRPIHPNEPRRPKSKLRRKPPTTEPPEEPAPDSENEASDHQVDDYA